MEREACLASELLQFDLPQPALIIQLRADRFPPLTYRMLRLRLDKIAALLS
ncbi:hypothetical protein NKI72_26930 [Mesorhizobium sp. M0437]|uniref:hypothetical protein n=1 Tax=Mesorhizobium sp. M0437 TaxID=2956945 RepID=UPI003334FDA6